MMNNDYNNLNYSQQQYIPSNNYVAPMQPSNPELPNKKNNNKQTKIIILIVVGILIIMGGIFMFFFLKKDKDENIENNVTYSTAFFLRNDEKKYALFNEDGTQLTDFIFDRVDSFVNHSALVTKDNQYGIISENGKMTVDFGKYESIILVGALYHVHGNDGYHYIDGNDKILYDTNNYYIRSYIGRYYSILEDRASNTYWLLNDKAEKILNIPIIKGEDSPQLYEDDEYLSFFYHDTNYIIDKKTEKVVKSFNDSNPYCIQGSKKDGKGIIVNSCASYYQNSVKYKYIENNKIYDITEECDVAYFDKNDSLMCNIDTKKYLLDNNYDLGIDISQKNYLNNNTYATMKNVSDVDFYENGKKVNTVSCKEIYNAGYAHNGIYLLRAYLSSSCNLETERYEFYKTNGEKAFNKAFRYADLFDENGLAIVSDYGNTYYLIDSNGKQVSDEYSKISFLNGYYRVVKDELYGLLDKDGNEIIPCQYSDVAVSVRNHKSYAELETVDSDYIVYDIQEHKEILKTKDNPYLKDHYMIINDSKYYTYDGKLFYES